MHSDGEYDIVSKTIIEHLAEPETTYNFEVADFHTYYVGENGVCVHNAGTITSDVIPPLKVFSKNGKIYSINNRRLYAYKIAGVKSVPVKWVSRSSMGHLWTGKSINIIIIRGGSRYL